MDAASKAFLVEMKNKHALPELLESENALIAKNKLILLKEKRLEETGSPDYEEALGEWKNWLQQQFIKRLLARKKS